MPDNRQKVIAIVGPTGVGKSAVGVELAKMINGEIISADSMQVYIGMDIGTDKPSPAVLKEIPHHLIDIVNFKEDFSVAVYQEMARKAIADIHDRGKSPILVGGSGLYIRAALDPLEFPPGNISSDYRLHMLDEADGTPAQLWEKLREIDPEAAASIPEQNTRRVIRALEIIKETGELFSKKQKGWKERRSIYDTRFFGLTMNRSNLYERIENRVDKMMSLGFLSEVENLVGGNLSTAVTARQALGYKELIDYLQSRMSFDEALSTIKKRTRQYAKRQLTWFRADPRINWISIDEKDAGRVAGEIMNLVTKEWFIVR